MKEAGKMDKTKLLNMIKEAMDMEEKSIPIYTRHLEAAVFWTGMDEDTIKKIKEAFKYLASASAKHKETLDELYKRIKEAVQDAY